MAKLTLNDLANLQNQTSAVAAINDNNDLLETALENTLSRDGTSPNSMGATLDMDSNRIINLPEATTSTEPVRLAEFEDAIEDLVVGTIPGIVSMAGIESCTLTATSNTWTDIPVVTVTGDGTGAQVAAFLKPTTIASFIIHNGGSGYDNVATHQIQGCTLDDNNKPVGNHAAGFTLTLNGSGVITGVTVTNDPGGWIWPPQVNVFGGDGTADVEAVLTPTEVSEYLQVVTPGTGYTYATLAITNQDGNGTASATADVTLKANVLPTQFYPYGSAANQYPDNPDTPYASAATAGQRGHVVPFLDDDFFATGNNWWFTSKDQSTATGGAASTYDNNPVFFIGRESRDGGYNTGYLVGDLGPLFYIQNTLFQTTITDIPETGAGHYINNMMTIWTSYLPEIKFGGGFQPGYGGLAIQGVHPSTYATFAVDLMGMGTVNVPPYATYLGGYFQGNLRLPIRTATTFSLLPAENGNVTFGTDTSYWYTGYFYNLDLARATNASSKIGITNTQGGTAARAQIYMVTDAATLDINATSGAFDTSGIHTSHMAYIRGSGSAGLLFSTPTAGMLFGPGDRVNVKMYPAGTSFDSGHVTVVTLGVPETGFPLLVSGKMKFIADSNSTWMWLQSSANDNKWALSIDGNSAFVFYDNTSNTPHEVLRVNNNGSITVRNNPSQYGIYLNNNADTNKWILGTSTDDMVFKIAAGTTMLTIGAAGGLTLASGSFSGSGASLTNVNAASINGATVGTATATSGNLLIGSGSDWVTNAMSGDITINSTGVTAIGSSKVTNTMLAGSIAYSKLSLTGAILNADLAGSIAYSKLSLTGAILNADLAGSIAASKLVGTDIATVGTITSGTWSATAIGVTKGGTGLTTVAVDTMLYASAADTLTTDSSNLLFDHSNKILIIGTTIANVVNVGSKLAIFGAPGSSGQFSITSNGTTAAQMAFAHTIAATTTRKWAIYSSANNYDLIFHSYTATANSLLTLTTVGRNMILGVGSAAGTNATKTFMIEDGTSPPTAGVASAIQLYSASGEAKFMNAGGSVTQITGGFSTPSTVTANNATAIPGGGSTTAGFLFSSTATFGVFFGSGAPSLSAAKGSLYLRSDGSGTNDRMYVATNNSGTWTAVVTVA